MCNATATAAQSILNALKARLDNDSVFTAFDVTTDARDGTDERIDHHDTREIVRNEFIIGEFPDRYNQEAIELDVPNSPIAIVYFPDGKSASDHPKVKQITVPTINSPISQVAPSTIKQGGKTKDGDNFICNVTNDGRINVPKELYSQITVSGGTFDVHFNGSILYKKPIGSEERLVLKKSELAGGKRFRVGVDKTANTIIVEQV